MNAPTRAGGSEPPIEITVQSDPALLASLHQACAEEPWDASAMARVPLVGTNKVFGE